MERFLMLGAAGALLAMAGAAQAATPQVVVDIAPVQSLVAAVMAGAGVPALIVPPNVSPHGITMRPSQAQAVQNADLVITVGPDLVPWFLEAAAALAPDATLVVLEDVPGLSRPPMREGGAFEEDHNHDHDHDHDPEHGGDPHFWLDPRNAALWTGAIADALAAADPDQAPLYRANAAALRADLTALEAEITATLVPVRGRPFVVFHDAYAHFERRFDLPAAGAVSLSDAARPGPARVDQIHTLLRAAGAACVFAEPQFPDSLLALVTEGTGARTGVLDPLGAGIEPGPGLYPALLRQMAASLRDCLAP
jgi:zinc transport system substrate-binding protein